MDNISRLFSQSGHTSVAMVFILTVFTASNAAAGGKVEQKELSATDGSPFDLSDANRIKAGESEFNQSCATFCHGQNSSLFVGRTGLDETYVYETIRDGGAGGQSPMPAWGEVFSPEEIWELVAYLKSIGDW